MAGSDGYPNPLIAPGITVALEPEMHVMSLRYFESRGAFAAAVQRCLGLQLPIEPNAIAITVSDHEMPTLLAWRRPGESLLLCVDPAIIEAVATTLAGLGDGRASNLTGGASVVRIAGPQTGRLLSRIAGHDPMPASRGSRAARVADLPTVLVRTGPDVYLLFDRAFLEHMMQWLRVSIDEAVPHSSQGTNPKAD
jgi:heterotetrameric sarcosine oxidase gamma subunit